MPHSSPSYWQKLWSISLDGIRANLIPGIVLWIFSLGVVGVYYFLQETRPAFEWVMELKGRHGYLYSGIATAVFGGFIPFLYLWRTGRVPGGNVLSWGLFFVIYWAIRGIEVDALYRLQAWIFGGGNDWATVTKKVVVDQFIYCPFWSAPLTAICYGWKDAGFSWSRFRPTLNRKFVLFDIPGVLLSIWIVWIPATAIIYSLPSELQIPLFNIVLCFFVLLVSLLSKHSLPESGEQSLYEGGKS